jgi:hypothetical protein
VVLEVHYSRWAAQTSAAIEAVLTQLSSIRATNDVWDHLAAFVAFVSRSQQLSGFQDELVEGGDGVF